MTSSVLITDSYFDGVRFHSEGPYCIRIQEGRILDIKMGDSPDADSSLRVPFVMPGLVEAHCHLFLDGAELNFNVRKEYLKASREEMLAVARRSVEANIASGITLVRDAGDIYGINDEIKSELSNTTTEVTPELRSPGRAIRKAGRYGSFMAVEATDHESIVRIVKDLATTADDIKILLTGIIDFEKGQMKGGTQFDLDATHLLVQTSKDLGLLTYAHCSGPDGLTAAVTAGIDSIEHGFFMEEEILRRMADQGTAWVPTFSPVYFQYERPDLAGWNEQTVEGLLSILDNHFKFVKMADEIGVPIIAGSDAGSYGVPHGKGLIDELFFLLKAGISIDHVLAATTSVPRRLWGCESANIAPGNAVNLIALSGSPAEDTSHLRNVQLVMRGERQRCYW